MPSFLDSPSKPISSYSSLTTFILIFSTLCNLYLLLSLNQTQPIHFLTKKTSWVSNNSPHHLVFGIASSSKTWFKRNNYIRIWWKPQQQMRGFVFLDRFPPPGNQNSINGSNDFLPPILISGNTSHFPYTYRGGLRSAIRIGRIVKEIFDQNLTDVRWFVFGDDDTVFFVDNLVKTLSKYDHNLWYYIGSNSESFEQNSKYSFEMAYGGGGFAISYSLARVLAKFFDSCLMRYPHLYGSDGRVFACCAELGIGLTHEPGFHQVDMRGNLFGLLAAHPLVPLVSLHHLDYMDPIFPGMNRSQSMKRLFEAVEVDPERILQQVVCYGDPNWSISISWGYAIQLFESKQLLPDLLRLQRTFLPWKRGVNPNSVPYMFNTRDFPKDPCKRPVTFFMESVISDTNGTRSNYKRHSVKKCPRKGSSKNLEMIRVFSQKIELDAAKLEAPRRPCCDVLPSSSSKKLLEIGIRECRNDELIAAKY